MASICMKTMRFLLGLVLLAALGADTFGQGVAIRSLNGKGTNFNGFGTNTLLGKIQLGDAGATATTESSNTFRFREQVHAHSSFLMQALTADRVLYLGAGKDIAASAGVTGAELEFLDGVTSSIQAQIDAIIGGGGPFTNLVVYYSLHVAGTNNGRFSLQDTNGTTNVVFGAWLNGVVGIGTNNPQVNVHAFRADTTDIARLESTRGNVLKVGTNGISVGAGGAWITNMLTASAALDFPSTVAGTASDLPITVTGVTSNNCVVTFGVPWQSVPVDGAFTHFESNDTVYIRYINNDLVTARDPNPGTFTVIVFRPQ